MSNTNTKLHMSELAGHWKLAAFQVTAITTATETITLTLAADNIREIGAVLACTVVEGQDANLMTAHVTFSGLVLTLKTLGADGGAATNWDGAKVNVLLAVN
jgi:hypothetical protein